MYKINGELSDLDTYEPQFFFPEETWMETEYTVELTVTDPTVTEIFYFCHIHNLMSGRCVWCTKFELLRPADRIGSDRIRFNR